MRIKKLELVGFKSFKDRTVIQFGHGITGIVGPNGCGKSNIVDALVWVMGEMSAKHLRGSKMDDVIFAGAEGYAPTGMAEVSLTLENDGGPFPAAYQRMSEVMITRRLHRDGESEYLINNEPARLRDIQEIFMDTGAGSKGFSIIEQGAIGKIVTAKPEDRRTLIEEAAGITKFKVRKRESQRKLETTEQNLTRLQDIIGEQKRQLDSLERQAQRAERYRQLKNELQDKDLLYSSKSYISIREEMDQKDKLISEQTHLEAVSSQNLEQIELQWQELHLKMTELEVDLNKKQLSYREKVRQIQETEIRIKELNMMMDQAQKSNEMAGSLSSQLKARKDHIERELQQLIQTYTDLKEKSILSEHDWLTRKTQLENSLAQEQAIEKELIDKRREMLSLATAESHWLSQKTSLEQRKEDLHAQLQSSLSLLNDLNSKKLDYEARRNSLFKTYESERQLQLMGLNDIQLLRQNLQQVQDTYHIQRSENDLLKNEYSKVASHLYGLEELQNSFEGYNEGVKSLLLWQRKRQEHTGHQELQIFSPLSEIIEVHEKFEMAMEAALGSKLQALVALNNENSQNDIFSAIDYLKETQSGRSTFIDTQILKAKTTSETQNLIANFKMSSNDSGLSVVPQGALEPLRAEPGFVSFLEEVVVANTIRAEVLSFFMNGVVVFDTLENALQACQSQKYQNCTFVTLDGDYVSTDGLISAGASASNEASLLKRKREIKELSLKREELSGKLQLSTLSLKKLNDQIEGLEQQLEVAEKSQFEKEILLAQLKKDLERAEFETSQVLLLIENEKNKKGKIESLYLVELEKFNQALELHKEYSEKKITLEKQTESLTQNLALQKQSIAQLHNESTQYRIQFENQQFEIQSLERQIALYEQNRTEITIQLTHMSEESERHNLTLTQSQIDLEICQANLQKMLSDVQEDEIHLNRLKDQFEQISQQKRHLESEKSRLQSEVFQLRKAYSDHQISLEQLKTKESLLLSQIYERYQLNLLDCIENYREAEVDLVQLQLEIEDKKDKLKRIGDVNLAAIQEFNEISQRYEFLKKQHDDLIEAKEHLKKVIDKINKICSRRFKETFELVNERFKKVFPVLFGGGEASLILVDTSENEDLGIDIIARPPGKKMQSINLLSGGEKALTAVSLIFSIFLVKPSPFCLLDEVDAPLDDANVFRFNDLVKEMAKRSQIIVVTHNKHTMKVNDKLYGVTMQEKGVSKMVSVSLSEAEQIPVGA